MFFDAMLTGESSDVVRLPGDAEAAGKVSRLRHVFAAQIRRASAGESALILRLHPQSGASPRGAVALTVGSAPRRIVPELRHFHWLLKMNNQSN